MKIYNYHTRTGEFLGATDADENPLVPGEYLIPASATKIAPDLPQDDETAVFDGQKWSATIDQRGVEYWLPDGSHKIITELGETKPQDALSEPVTLQNMSKRIGEFRDFMTMFSSDEQLRIVAATQSNPVIKLWYDKAMGGPNFSLDHPETKLGLQALVSAGLLQQSRMDDILNTDFSKVS